MVRYPVSVSVSVSVSTQTHTHTPLCQHTHKDTHTPVSVCVSTHTPACLCVCMYIYMCVCIYMYIYTGPRGGDGTALAPSSCTAVGVWGVRAFSGFFSLFPICKYCSLYVKIVPYAAPWAYGAYEACVLFQGCVLFPFVEIWFNM